LFLSHTPSKPGIREKEKGRKTFSYGGEKGELGLRERDCSASFVDIGVGRGKRDFGELAVKRLRREEAGENSGGEAIPL